jgi:hypothetical protein
VCTMNLEVSIWLLMAARSTGTGNLLTANSYTNGTGILQLDANGPVDVRTTTGNCTVTIWTYGYVT